MFVAAWQVLEARAYSTHQRLSYESGLPPDLRRLSHHFTSFAKLVLHKSPPSELSTFLKKLKTDLVHSSLCQLSVFTMAFSGLITLVLLFHLILI